MQVTQVRGDDWHILAWLWQCFRHDLADVVNGLPYADGRYSTHGLPTGETADAAAYLAMRAHPNTGEDAPVGFAVVSDLDQPQRLMSALWIAPAARHDGLAVTFALDVIRRHPGAWVIPFQHENDHAGRFWRKVADAAFGEGAWTEEQRDVPGKPDVPGDHWIEGRT